MSAVKENVSNEKNDFKGSRREFAKFFLGGSIAIWAASALYAFARFLTPPISQAERLPKSVKIAKKAAEIPKNNGFVFAYGNRPAILIRKKSGKFTAFFASCPHLGCTVQYDPRSERILCACHEGVFDLEGKNLEGPPPRPLDTLHVRVDSHGDAYVGRTGAEET